MQVLNALDFGRFLSKMHVHFACLNNADFYYRVLYDPNVYPRVLIKIDGHNRFLTYAVEYARV